MIFVILGTQDKPFTRLLNAIEKQIEDSIIQEEVIVQAGITSFESKNMRIFDYILMEDFQRYIEEASLIITHAGVGSILTALKAHKPIIAAARESSYKEHVNDHQKEILNLFEEEKYILGLHDFDRLDILYKLSKTFQVKEYVSTQMDIVSSIRSYIDELK